MKAASGPVDQVLSETLAPLIEQDGGELFVVYHDDAELKLHLKGRFSGCPGNTLVIRQVIEPAILAVAPGLRVTVSSGELVPERALRYAAQPSPDSLPNATD